MQLVEQWFDENAVPQEYRMSVPFMLIPGKSRDKNVQEFYVHAFEQKIPTC
jgi:hypothetical protein